MRTWLLTTLFGLALSPCLAAQDAKPQIITGKLAAKDPLDKVLKKSHANVHTVTLKKDQVYLIDLQSKEFDPFLRLENDNGKQIAFNDDIDLASRNLNSRLGFAPTKTGKYRLIVTSFKGGETGDYQLRWQTLKKKGEAKVIAGKLTKKDRQTKQKQFYKILKAPFEAGQAYQIDVTSKEIDPLLLIVNAKGKVIVRDDDGGEGLNSRLFFVPSLGRKYFLVVQAVQPGSVGAFQLKLQPCALPNSKSSLKVVQPESVPLVVYGQLTKKDKLDPIRKGSYHKVHKIKLKKDKAYGIDLKSDQFDVFLRLEDAKGNKIAEDDDSGGNTDSWLLFAPKKVAEYRLVVTSFKASQEGAYLLSVQACATAENGKKRHAQERQAILWNQKAVQLYRQGKLTECLQLWQKALSMRKSLYSKPIYARGHPDLATSLNNMGVVLRSLGQSEKALPFHTQALEMHKRLYKDRDHPRLASSLNNMGFVFESLGQSEKALPFLTQALEMRKRLCKDHDHPDLATNLNNMGSVLKFLGQSEKALPFLTKALEMRKLLYKDQDHPDLAESLNNVGFVLNSLGQSHKALPFYTEALQMRKRLYKDRDHPDLASSLNNMGGVLDSLGQSEKALPFYTEALQMRKRLYKDRDHPDLATSLNNMGFFLQSSAQYEKAMPFLAKAVEMQKRLSGKVAYYSSTSEALLYLQKFPQTRSAVLSMTRQLPKTEAYQHIWTTKANLERLFRRRHQISLLAAKESQKVREIQTQLTSLERRRTGLLNRPVSPDRDKRMGDLNAERAKLERRLIDLLPEYTPLAKLELKQLTGALKEGEVFVDFYRYYDSAAKKGKRKDRYVAFVVTAKGQPKRVELKTVEPINKAITSWRDRLREWKPTLSPQDQRDLQQQADEQAAKLRRLVWEPIAKHLPPDAKRIYISPAEDLARLPFAALPGDKPGTVLLEQYALAEVPSGPFLLEHLNAKPHQAAASLLAVGGINYGPPGKQHRWQELPGTEREHQRVLALWDKRGTALSATGDKASTGWLIKHLSRARYAHLATHGHFNVKEFDAEQKRLAKMRQQFISGMTPRIQFADRRGLSRYSLSLGAKPRNPLSFVGLVMAGANQPAKDNPEGGIVLGTTITEKDLSAMHLAVLSACETGLGKHAGGVGVRNLQLAFHTSGCRNVIATLWKVDDKATAALMAKFYHELWQNNKAPIDALREAQLFVMRHPERIDSLAGERGGPAQMEVLNTPPPTESTTGKPASAFPGWAIPAGIGVLGLALGLVILRVKRLPGAVRFTAAVVLVGCSLYGSCAWWPSAESQAPSTQRLPAKYWAAFTLSGVGR